MMINWVPLFDTVAASPFLNKRNFPRSIQEGLVPNGWESVAWAIHVFYDFVGLQSQRIIMVIRWLCYFPNCLKKL